VSGLDAVRRAVRGVCWALAIGTGATVAHSALIVWLVPAWPRGDLSRAALIALAQAAVVLACAALAALVVELEPWTGALAGAFTSLLPASIVLSAEGPGALRPLWGARVATALLAMAAGVLGLRLLRRRAPRGPGATAEGGAAAPGAEVAAPARVAGDADHRGGRTGSCPPSAPTG
jgi:hypothetical protein